MKKSLFLSLAILLCSLLSAQNVTDAQGRKQGYWEKKDPQTQKTVYKGKFKDDKPQGVFTYYYAGTDSVRSKSDFRNDGKIAYVQMFHLKTGKLEAKGKYINEQKDSVWAFYDETGLLISLEGYKQGKKQGVSKIFFQDGKLSEQKNYNAGVLDGPFKMFFDEKNVKAEGKYVNGNYDGICAWYYPTGIAAAKGIYDNGKKKGVWIYKDKEGKITAKEVWDNGRQLNEKEAEEYLKKNKGTTTETQKSPGSNTSKGNTKPSQKGK